MSQIGNGLRVHGRIARVVLRLVGSDEGLHIWLIWPELVILFGMEVKGVRSMPLVNSVRKSLLIAAMSVLIQGTAVSGCGTDTSEPASIQRLIGDSVAVGLRMLPDDVMVHGLTIHASYDKKIGAVAVLEHARGKDWMESEGPDWSARVVANSDSVRLSPSSVFFARRAHPSGQFGMSQKVSEAYLYLMKTNHASGLDYVQVSAHPSDIRRGDVDVTFEWLPARPEEPHVVVTVHDKSGQLQFSMVDSADLDR